MRGLELVLLVCCAAAHVAAYQEDYEGHQLVRVQVSTPEEADFLLGIQEEYDFWTRVAPTRPLDIRCTPDSCSNLLEVLTGKGMKYEILQENLGPLVKLTSVKPRSQRNLPGDLKHTMDWEDYKDIEDIHSFMTYLEETYDFVSTEIIGQSYLGEDMIILKVCRGGCGSKPAIWIDGGIHAREWITHMTVPFMMRELVENDADHPELTENLDWYMLPVVNPDGYRFTQTDNRFWRKTRSENSGCVGVDANRNWGFHWGTGGSSPDPCSDTYMGPEAFSEVENRNVRDFLLANKDQIKMYNNIHSYSQLVLLPWGWGYDLPDNYDDLLAVATAGEQALEAVHGKVYEVGCIPCMLYIASGGSLDWTLGEAGIPYSYGMELRDTGSYGFVLPPEQIIPTGEEVWAFHMTVARELISEFVP